MKQEDDATISAQVGSEKSIPSIDLGEKTAAASGSELITGFQSLGVDGSSDVSIMTSYNADHAPSSSSASNGQNGSFVSKYGLYKGAIVSSLFLIDLIIVIHFFVQFCIETLG